MINTSLQKNPSKKHINKHQEIKKDTCLNAYSYYQCRKVAKAIQKRLSREKKVKQNFWKVGRNGPKAEKEDRISNRARQNNKRADRKMESNDSPGIPDREEASEEPGLPLGQKNIIDRMNGPEGEK